MHIGIFGCEWHQTQRCDDNSTVRERERWRKFCECRQTEDAWIYSWAGNDIWILDSIIRHLNWQIDSLSTLCPLPFVLCTGCRITFHMALNANAVRWYIVCDLNIMRKWIGFGWNWWSDCWCGATTVPGIDDNIASANAAGSHGFLPLHCIYFIFYAGVIHRADGELCSYVV